MRPGPNWRRMQPRRHRRCVYPRQELRPRSSLRAGSLQIWRSSNYSRILPVGRRSRPRARNTARYKRPVARAVRGARGLRRADRRALRGRPAARAQRGTCHRTAAGCYGRYA